MKTGLPGRLAAHFLLVASSLAMASCQFFGWGGAARGGKGEIVLSFSFPEPPAGAEGSRLFAGLGRAPGARALDPGTTSIKVTVSGPGMDPVTVTASRTPPVSAPDLVTVPGILYGANRTVSVEVFTANGSYGTGSDTGITVASASTPVAILILPSAPLAWSLPRMSVTGLTSATVFVDTLAFAKAGAYTITVDPDATNPFASAYLWMDDGSLSGASYSASSRSFFIPSASIGSRYYLGLYHDTASIGAHGLARYLTETGTPDAGFGPGGLRKASFATGVPTTVVRKAARQADGSIVFVGTLTRGAAKDFYVCRFTPDGFLDAGFGSGKGWVAVDSLSAEDEAYDVAIQGDGKIVVAGTDGADFLVARLNANGSLDAGFGASGLKIVDFGAGAYDCAFALAIDPATGDIVLAGQSNSAGDVSSYGGVARLAVADGALDLSFNTTGMRQVGVVTSAPANPTFFAALAIDATSRIWLAGRNWNGSSYEGYIASVDAAGALRDGTGGFVDTYGYWVGSPALGASPTGGFTAIALTDGGSGLGTGAYKVIACGSFDVDLGNEELTLTRFYPGTDITAGAAGVDVNFGPSVNGWVPIRTGGGADNDVWGRDMKIQASDGYIVVFGDYLDANPIRHAFSARVDAAGMLDSAYDFDGKSQIYYGNLGGNTHYYAVSGFLDASNNPYLAIAAHADAAATDSIPAVMRMSAIGGSINVAVDASAFSGDGMAVESFVPEARFLASAMQDDGKVLAAGWRLGNANSEGILMRYNADGSLDAGFGTGGLALLAPVGDCAIHVIRLLPDGTILAAGQYAPGNSFIARFTSGGILDTGFSGDGIVSFSTSGSGVSVVKDLDVDPGTGNIFGVGWDTAGNAGNLCPVTFFCDAAGASPGGGNLTGYTAAKLSGVRFVDSATVLAVGYQSQASMSDIALKFAVAAPGIVTGSLVWSDPPNNRQFTGLAKTRDGAFYACGYENDGSASKLLGLVVKIDASGANPTVDTSVWSGTGKAYFNAEGGQRDQILSITAHPDGKLLVSGCSLIDNSHKLYVARIDAAAGGVDMSFNAGSGYLFLPSTATGAYAYPGGPRNAAFESVAIGLDSVAAAGWFKGNAGAIGPAVLVAR